MLNLENLVKVQSKIVNEWLETSQGSKKYPRFYQKVRGHFDYIEVSIPTVTPHFDVLSPDLKEEIKLIASELNKNKGEKFQTEESESDHSIISGPSIIEGIIFGCYEAFIRAYLDPENSGDGLSKFPIYATQFATQILEWNKSSGSRQLLIIVITPAINLGDYNKLGDWETHYLNWIEASREAHVHGQPGQDGLMRIIDNTWFRRDISNFTGTEEDLVQEAEQLVLSLSLALKQPFQIEDMRTELSPWMFAPDRSSYFWLRFQPIWTSPKELLPVQFFGNIASSAERAPSAPLSELEYNRINKWENILQANPNAVFALKLIQQGLWKVYKSNYEALFRRKSTSLNGMFDVLSGMEGLITKCVPKEEDATFIKRMLNCFSKVAKGQGQKTITRAFRDCWSTLWIKRLDSSASPFLNLSRGKIRNAVYQMYDLRSRIAHSDDQLLPEALERTKKAMGDYLNPTIYDAPSTTLYLAFICVELIEVFHDEPILLTKLMRGEEP
jgi:hypothetical protein